MAAFIEAHGSSRFEAAWDEKAERIVNRVGFRRREGDGDWQYMILPEAWRGEVAKSFDAAALARAMADRGLILRDGAGKTSQPIKVPGQGSVRLYVLALDFLSRAGAQDAR